MDTALYRITEGLLDGWRLRARADGRIEAHSGTGVSEWILAPLRVLARHYPVDSEVWVWLRAHGVKRPSPSGPSGRSKAPAKRSANAGRRRIDTWISAEAGARLDELARGRTVRETIEALLLESRRRL